MIFLIVPFLAFTILGPALQLTFSRAMVWLCGAALLFSGVAVCRWAGILPMPEELIFDNIRQIPRVLVSDIAMIIGLAMIAIVGSMLSRGVRMTGILTITFFAAVLVGLQHRSVWTATAVGLVWLAVRSLHYASLKRCIQLAVAGSAVAITALLFIVASGNAKQLTSMLEVNIEEATKEDSTFAWRLSGFGEAIDRTFSGGPVDIVLGPPSGRDLTDIASFASTHIHNRYIDTLAYYGVLGLLLLLALLRGLAARVLRIRSSVVEGTAPDLAGLVLQAILLSELTYFLAYFGNLAHGAILGLLWVTSAAVFAPQRLPAAVRPAASVVADPLVA
jgi:O-antigen ligase